MSKENIESKQDIEGYLFETGSAKYIELISGNSRFHSDKAFATLVKKSVFDDEEEKSALLDSHNIDWYEKTIKFHEKDGGFSREKPHRPRVELEFYLPDGISDSALEAIDVGKSDQFNITFCLSGSLMFVSMKGDGEGEVEDMIGSVVKNVRKHCGTARLNGVECIYPDLD